jgi:hypothetical protein
MVCGLWSDDREQVIPTRCSGGCRPDLRVRGVFFADPANFPRDTWVSGILMRRRTATCPTCRVQSADDGGAFRGSGRLLKGCPPSTSHLTKWCAVVREPGASGLESPSPSILCRLTLDNGVAGACRGWSVKARGRRIADGCPEYERPRRRFCATRNVKGSVSMSVGLIDLWIV